MHLIQPELEGSHRHLVVIPRRDLTPAQRLVEPNGRCPLSTLRRLIGAAGFDLSVELRSSSPRRVGLSGPIGNRVHRQRSRILAAAAAHGVSNLRVFGSVARGDDDAASDVDLLVDLPAGMGLLGLARLQRDLEEILQSRVDIVPPTAFGQRCAPTSTRS